MLGTVAVRECSLSHCCIAALQDCEILGCVLQSLLGPMAINLAYRNSKSGAPILFPAPFGGDDDTA